MNIADFIPSVEQQLESPRTPFVKAALERLVGEEEIDAEESVQMIALCLADEVEAMTLEERPFDENRYRNLLELLPTLPEGR
jgi:hypothetical protein